MLLQPLQLRALTYVSEMHDTNIASFSFCCNFHCIKNLMLVDALVLLFGEIVFILFAVSFCYAF